MQRGLSRESIKVAVHDYKVREYVVEQLPVQPDYWCRKIEIKTPEDETWIHYMSHELVGLTKEEAEKYYHLARSRLAEPMRIITG